MNETKRIGRCRLLFLFGLGMIWVTFMACRSLSAVPAVPPAPAPPSDVVTQAADMLARIYTFATQTAMAVNQVSTTPIALSTQTSQPLAGQAPPTHPTPGAIWASLQDGMVMAYIPAGVFQMGAVPGDVDAQDDEKPRHEVSLDGFWIDTTEVTNAMFARFVVQTGYRTEAEKQGSGYIFDTSAQNWEDRKDAAWNRPRGPGSDLSGPDQHPVVLVSWDDAAAYCAWAGKRLPTEAEWEKAARGGLEDRRYPWGDADPDCSKANYWGKDGGCVGDTQPVASYPPNGYGLYDMVGNVWEWVQDWDNTGLDTEGRVVRGGSWYDIGWDLYVSDHLRYAPTISYNILGFRCAR